MRNIEKKLTTVKLDPRLYDQFKIKCVSTKFSFQKLATRAMYLYLTDLSFREKVHNQTKVEL